MMISEKNRKLAREAIRGPRFRLFLAALLFQFTFASGHLFTFDEVALENIAASIVDDGTVELHFGPELRLYYKPGIDGKQYSKFGIGMSAALVPFYAAGKIVGLAVGATNARLVADIVASFANCFFVALIAPCFFTMLILCGATERSAKITTLMLLFCTTLPVYGRGLFNDALTGLFVTIAVQMLLAEKHVWSGAAVGVALATRAEYALLAPALAIVVFLTPGEVWKLSTWKKTIRFLAPIFAMGLLLAAYNFGRFGSPTDQGTLTDNPHDVFSTPLHVGLFGLIASPGKGIVWYAAPVWLAVWGMPDLAKTNRRLLGMIGVIVVPLLLLHAHWHSWMGGWSYGPRRLVALLPVIMIPAAFLIERMIANEQSRRGVSLLVAVAAVGFAAQLAGLTTNFMSYLHWAQSHQVSTLWTFEHSSMIGQLHWLFGTGWLDLWYTNLFGLSLPSAVIGFLLSAATVVAGISCIDVVKPSG